jgi:hypothetical protein
MISSVNTSRETFTVALEILLTGTLNCVHWTVRYHDHRQCRHCHRPFLSKIVTDPHVLAQGQRSATRIQNRLHTSFPNHPYASLSFLEHSKKDTFSRTRRRLQTFEPCVVMMTSSAFFEPAWRSGLYFGAYILFTSILCLLTRVWILHTLSLLFYIGFMLSSTTYLITISFTFVINSSVHPTLFVQCSLGKPNSQKCDTVLEIYAQEKTASTNIRPRCIWKSKWCPVSHFNETIVKQTFRPPTPVHLKKVAYISRNDRFWKSECLK